MKQITIMIADDHPVICKALRHAIAKKHPDWQIIGDATDGIKLLEMIEEKHPDLVIVDLEMPRIKGYEVIREINDAYPGIKSIVFSGFLNTENQNRARECGASATISKSCPTDELIKALEYVISGKQYHSKTSSFMGPIPAKNEGDNLLTFRERQILTHIAEGKTSKQISRILKISHLTVNKHRSNLKEKLKVSSIAELVKYAINNGYLT